MSDTVSPTVQASALLGMKKKSIQSKPDFERKASAQESRKQLDTLVHEENTQALYSFQAVFPFDLFPDKVIIDRNKITLSRRYFFFDRAIQSILIKDLMTIVVEESLFFATFQIVDRLLPHQTIVVTHLPKNEAKIARRIIEGLLISDKKKIDLSSIPTSELVEKLSLLGKTVSA